MSAVLKKWLAGRLGVIYDMRPEFFGAHVSDGTVLAKLLLSYNIIHFQLSRDIVETKNEAAKLNNLRLLKVWLDFIGVTVDDEMLRQLASGNGHVAIALFYQLFFCLEGKDCLHFMAREAKKDNLTVLNSRFQVEKVDETPEKSLSFISEDELKRIPSQKMQMLQKFEEQYTSILQQSQPAQPKSLLNESAYKKCTTKGTTSTWGKMKSEGERITKRPTFQKYDSIGMKISRAIMYPKHQPKLKRKSSKELAYSTFKGKMKQIVLQELWETLLREQEQRFDDMILEKLMKQSQYEKKMTTKIFHVRDQKKVMMQNRMIVESMLLEKQQQEADKEQLFTRENEEIAEIKNHLEEKRKKELQFRMDEEKRLKQYQRHYETSKKVVEALVDFGARAAEYKKLVDGPVPQKLWDEWKALYLKGKPIYDVLADPTSLIDETFVEEMVSAVQLEAERQAVLNEHDFAEYMEETGPWSEEEIQIDPPVQVESLNVLGYIVHKLLAMKYPFPPGPTQVTLPNYSVAAILIGHFDEPCINTLKNLLAFRAIQVVTMDVVINSCLEMYSLESSPALIEKNLDKDLKFDAQSKKSSKKSKRETSGNTSLSGDTSIIPPLPVEKGTQTSVSLETVPAEEPTTPTLSPIATLGRDAFGIMSEGIELPDSLLVDMIGEYLLTLTDVNGWVLLNYPQAYSQASLLEEKLTGMKMPKDPAAEESPEIILCKQKRTSGLVPQTEDVEDPENFKTYFTAYINTKTRDLHADNESRDTDDVMDDEPTPLEMLYTDQGMNYTFYYQSFNFTTLKKVARIVIGDMEMPFKTSVELFGELALEADDSEKQNKESGSSPKTAKAQEPNAEKQVSADKTSVDSACSNISSGRSKMKNTSLEAPPIVPSAVVVIPLKPGELGFPYANFAQPLEIRLALANLWETLEQTYTRSFKQIFFSKRIYYSHIVPYINYVTKFVKEYITRPDRKQEVVHDFHTRFNEMEEELREDIEIKCELHCRVSELRHTLWNMCDIRKNEAENERCSIILESWLAIEMISLSNLFITAMQIECDRCVDTMQLISDYYLSMLSIYTASDKVIEKISMLRMSQIDEAWDNLLSSYSEEKIREKTSNVSITSNSSIKSVVAKILIHCHEVEPFVTPCHTTIVERERKATQFVESVEGMSRDICHKQRSATLKDSGKGGKGGKNIKGKGISKSTVNEEESPIIKARQNMFEEWARCIVEEASRAKYRLQLLRAKAMKDLSSLLEHVQKMFIGLYDAIGDRYAKEIESVDVLCDYICTAIEDELPIQKQLVLEGETFVVRSDILLFPPPPTPPPDPTEERISPMEFRISQLIKLQERLSIAAPSGSIPEAALLYLFEDMLMGGSWEGEDSVFPDRWYNFTHEDVQSVLDYIFGGIEYVDWVDFIICAADLPYPTETELLSARAKFRSVDYNNDETVFRDDFYATKLWFEEEDPEDPQVQLRLERAKILLFRTFKVGNFKANYTKLLLGFCKDEDPKQGFLKALALSTGKHIVMDGESVTDEDFLTEEEVSARLELAKKAKQMAGELVENLLEEAIQTTEGLLLTEITDGDSEMAEQEDDKEDERKSDVRNPSTSSAVFHAPENYGTKEDVLDSSLLSESALPKDQVWISSVPFEVALIVLVSALPWLAKQPQLSEGLPSLRACLEEIFAGNKSVDVRLLLEHEAMNTILSATNKFTAVSITVILNNIAEDHANDTPQENEIRRRDISFNI